MRRACLMAVVVCCVTLSAGCGEKDLNKDLKPISPNAPRPTASGGVDASTGPAQKAPVPLK